MQEYPRVIQQTPGRDTADHLVQRPHWVCETAHQCAIGGHPQPKDRHSKLEVHGVVPMEYLPIAMTDDNCFILGG